MPVIRPSTDLRNNLTNRYELYRLTEKGLDDVKNNKVISLEASCARIEALVNAI